MPVTTFNVDSQMDATLDRLKEHYGAASKAEIVRKAIALLNVVSRIENADGSVTIRSINEELKVIFK